MQATMYEFTCPFCEHSTQVAEVNDGAIITCTNPTCGKKFEADLPKVEPESHGKGDAGLIVPPDLKKKDDLPVAKLASEVNPGTKLPEEKEEVIAVYPVPMFRRYPLLFLGYVALVALGLWGFYSGWVNDYWGLRILSLLPIGFGLWRLVHWWLKTRNASVTITSKSVIIREGIFSLVTREINHQAISQIHIYQPLLCKLFHSGALILVLSESKEEIGIDAVMHPHTITNQIRYYAEKKEPVKAAESEKIVAQ